MAAGVSASADLARAAREEIFFVLFHGFQGFQIQISWISQIFMDFHGFSVIFRDFHGFQEVSNLLGEPMPVTRGNPWGRVIDTV